MTGIPIRRTTLIGITVGIALVTVGTALSRMPEWLGSWGESGAVLEDATILTYPLTAALAAWMSGSPRRRRYEPLLRTASRSLRGVYLRSAAWLGAAAAAGSLVAAAVVYLLTAGEATYSGPSFVVLGVICCGYWAAVSGGVLAGTVLPSYVAPAAACGAVYALEVLVDPGDPGLAPFAGLIVADGRERTYLSTLEPVLALRAGWLIAVGVCLVTIAARTPAKWLIPFAATCLLSVPLLLAGDSGMQVDEAATRPVCQRYGDVAAICMTSARAHVADEVWAALKPELDLLDGLSGQPIQFVEETLAPTDPPRGTTVVPFGVINGNSGNAHQVDVKQLQLTTASLLLTDSCAPGSGAPSGSGLPPATANDVILLWVLRQLDIQTDGTAYVGAPILDESGLDFSRVAAFRSAWDDSSSTRRSAWLAANRAAVATCDPSVTRMDDS